MTLQNRVDPFGAIFAYPARGTMMGNRGRLHDTNRRLTARRWTTKAWICCLLDFRGRKRTVMAPGRYTELFFLDEATAFAAGHRPCAECRRADYRAFMEAWARGNGDFQGGGSWRSGDVDARLHGERVGGDASRPCASGASRLRAEAVSLPDGAMVTLDTDDAQPWLVWRGGLHPWRPDGYGAPIPLPDGAVAVLTPPSTVRTLAAGYRPGLHHSAGN